MLLEENILLIKKAFEDCQDKEAIYHRLLAFGKNLPLSPLKEFSEEDRVLGCQSQMYVKSFVENNNIYFNIYSDSLISQGLAALLLSVYNGIPPEHLVKSTPSFLKELNILPSLSPSRSNGVLSLFTKMQQLSLKHLVNIKN